MWALFCLDAIMVFGIPAFLIWAWRGKFLPANRSGMRLEEHRKSVKLLLKRILPIWGLLVVSSFSLLAELYPLSHHWGSFWNGFRVASLLFLSGFVINNFCSLHQEAKQRRHAA